MSDFQSKPSPSRSHSEDNGDGNNKKRKHKHETSSSKSNESNLPPDLAERLNKVTSSVAIKIKKPSVVHEEKTVEPSKVIPLDSSDEEKEEEEEEEEMPLSQPIINDDDSLIDEVISINVKPSNRYNSHLSS
jgi:hypothetical protein